MEATPKQIEYIKDLIAEKRQLAMWEFDAKETDTLDDIHKRLGGNATWAWARCLKAILGKEYTDLGMDAFSIFTNKISFYEARYRFAQAIDRIEADIPNLDKEQASIIIKKLQNEHFKKYAW
jgi:hypothetical protein